MTSFWNLWYFLGSCAVNRTSFTEMEALHRLGAHADDPIESYPVVCGQDDKPAFVPCSYHSGVCDASSEEHWDKRTTESWYPPPATTTDASKGRLPSPNASFSLTPRLTIQVPQSSGRHKETSEASHEHVRDVLPQVMSCNTTHADDWNQVIDPLLLAMSSSSIASSVARGSPRADRAHQRQAALQSTKPKATMKSQPSKSPTIYRAEDAIKLERKAMAKMRAQGALAQSTTGTTQPAPPRGAFSKPGSTKENREETERAANTHDKEQRQEISRPVIRSRGIQKQNGKQARENISAPSGGAASSNVIAVVGDFVVKRYQILPDEFVQAKGQCVLFDYDSLNSAGLPREFRKRLRVMPDASGQVEKYSETIKQEISKSVAKFLRSLLLLLLAMNPPEDKVQSRKVYFTAARRQLARYLDEVFNEWKRITATFLVGHVEEDSERIERLDRCLREIIRLQNLPTVEEEDHDQIQYKAALDLASAC